MEKLTLGDTEVSMTEEDGLYYVVSTAKGETVQEYKGKDSTTAKGVFFGWVLEEMKSWAEDQGLTQNER